MTHKNAVTERIAELEALAQAEGLTLPMPAAGIVLVEMHGHTVDLRSGAVLQGGAYMRYGLHPDLLVLAGGEVQR